MMKTRRSILGFTAAALAGLVFSLTSVQAGPGPQQVFRPVKTTKQLGALKPGSSVAHSCPHCGTLSIAKVDEEKSHAKGFTCPQCKMKFEYRDSGGGKARSTHIVCVDAKSGKEMSAQVCASH